nr:hypothetical protein [Mycoplasmopsis bovis]
MRLILEIKDFGIQNNLLQAEEEWCLMSENNKELRFSKIKIYQVVTTNQITQHAAVIFPSKTCELRILSNNADKWNRSP